MAKLIGTDPNQVPTNADLGTMAYQDSKNTVLENAYINAKGADGLEMGRDYTSPNNSSRLFFNSSVSGGNWTIFNNSGSLKIQSGAEAGSTSGNYTSVALSTSGMVLSGTVQKPNQPAFYAYRTTDLSAPANTSTTVTFPSININRGSHYNTSNGRFTAPVDGVYFFTVTLQVNSPSNNPHAGLEVNGSSVIFLDWNASKAAIISRAIYLTAGDYVNAKIYVTVGDTIVNGDRNSFSGFLVG
jgi:hypothetical protein